MNNVRNGNSAVQQVKNLRSQVARSGICCLADMYTSLGKQMDNVRNVNYLSKVQSLNVTTNVAPSQVHFNIKYQWCNKYM